MSWGHPQWLWALAAVPLLALALLLLSRHRQRMWNRLADPRMAPRIDLTRRGRRPAVRALLLLFAATFVVLALARPQWGDREEELRARGLDLVIALDLSRSMLAEDLAPSRLTVARSVAREIGRRLPSDRIALIGFARSAEVLCPLTLDRGSLELYLDAADPSIFSAQGTDLGAAIQRATELFSEQDMARRVLVIISDGEDHQPGAMASVAAAREAGLRIYCIGLGTLGGAPVPLRGPDGRVTGYLQDDAGNVVTSRLQESALAELAEASSGAYVRATGFGQGLETLIEQLGRLERDELAESLVARKSDRYRIPLGLAFLLVLAEAGLVDRRRRL